ncbi:amino acid ABC transporter substrate-binding protein [Paraphotobacterium marinum]|uniref:Amino acid ABC transporter substrate-binding protein n=1 Tax=Paraphotobacterium marinum TaxID=1755811 RepID=A0A220VD88_9GAMM|nr:transporter substrate-binding domain-containing protein [Paraphotobacterium marinum]ASK78142.1 amino acid ABC transporter substrate-binding protein [Paraphotobacterium marinum]
MKLILKYLFLIISIFLPFFSMAQTFNVGLSGNYPPFGFLKNDKLSGFEIDVWNQIAQRTNNKVKFTTSNFSGLFGLLETGRIDTIANQITPTTERKNKYLFSQPYTYGGAQFAVKKDSKYQKISDLKGKSIVVNLGTDYEQMLKAYNAKHQYNFKIVTMDTGIEQNVIIGHSASFVMDRASILYNIKKFNLPIRLLEKPFNSIQSAYPFVKNEKGIKLKKLVDSTIQKMREDGSLTKISIKWFGADITKSPN